MAICVVVYFLTLPASVQQEKKFGKALHDLATYLENNPAIVADDRVRDKLRELGLNGIMFDMIEEQLESDPELKRQYNDWLMSADAREVRQKLDEKIAAFKEANDTRVYSRYGLAGGGQWKAHQLITYAFIHENTNLNVIVFPVHLVFNMLFFFAVAFTLEDLWGRAIFAVFYLLSAVAACIPDMLAGMGLIGASGAVFATFGAFLVRLPQTKLKVGWLTVILALPFKFFGKKNLGIVNIYAYLIIGFFFIDQMLLWWFINFKLGANSGVSYRCHIAGFAFGAIFALGMKAMKIEENYINPKIEAKVSFSNSPLVTQALELLERGSVDQAEVKLKSYAASHPNNLDGILGLIQVYRKKEDFEQLNVMYSRMIRYHLDRNDREAALYAYDSLLSEFPENKVEVRIPARDWLVLCEFLREAEMIKEAAVEYERLATTHPTDPISMRACVQGGEAALLVGDTERAMRLFQKGLAMNPVDAYRTRLQLGFEKCQKRLSHRHGAGQQPKKSLSLSPETQKQKV
jgi:membrane associated rhomboid family serine protease